MGCIFIKIPIKSQRVFVFEIEVKMTSRYTVDHLSENTVDRYQMCTNDSNKPEILIYPSKVNTIPWFVLPNDPSEAFSEQNKETWRKRREMPWKKFPLMNLYEKLLITSLFQAQYYGRQELLWILLIRHKFLPDPLYLTHCTQWISFHSSKTFKYLHYFPRYFKSNNAQWIS